MSESLRDHQIELQLLNSAECLKVLVKEYAAGNLRLRDWVVRPVRAKSIDNHKGKGWLLSLGNMDLN